MIETVLRIGTAVACAVVLWRAEMAINHMTRRTNLWVRWSMWQLAVVAGAELLAITLSAYQPEWREAMMAGGVASLMMCERRLRYLARTRQERQA